MSPDVRAALVALSLAFLIVGGYHRLLAARSGERLDRTREGWLTLISVRLAGLLTLGSTAVCLWNPARLAWAAFPVPYWVRWIGVAGYASGVAWLIWMFLSLGSNLTDTVVVRQNAHFVDYGPYRYVRNPMYLGILILGVSLGLAVGTWLVPLAATVMFLILTRRTQTEEAYLVARFGDRYRAYMKRTGRFFPSVTRRYPRSRASDSSE